MKLRCQDEVTVKHVSNVLGLFSFSLDSLALLKPAWCMKTPYISAELFVGFNSCLTYHF